MVANDDDHLQQPDRACAALPRPQVRPDPAEGILQPPGRLRGGGPGDRPYDPDPRVARRRAEETKRLADLRQGKRRLESKAGPELATIDARLARLSKSAGKSERPEYGYHSAIEKSQDVVKWVQVDLGRPTPIARVVLVGASDSFAGIGAGFGFPVRYKVEASDDPGFSADVTAVVDRSGSDQLNPGTTPQVLPAGGVTARYAGRRQRSSRRGRTTSSWRWPR